MMMDLKEFLKRYEKIWALRYSMNLLSWDEEVIMPKKSFEERGYVKSIIEGIIYDFYTDKEIINFVESYSPKDDFEKGIIRVVKRDLKIYKIPKELLMEYNKLISESFQHWVIAKEKNNYDLFKPYLQKIIDYNKKFAEYLGYDEYKYDALLDLYEEGLRVKDLEKIFNPLKKKLIDILNNLDWIREHELEKREYEKESMVKLNKTILKILGFDFNYMRLDVSPHPFTMNIGLYDIRITTWYHNKDFKRSLLATIHEFGHALYEKQIDPNLWRTPLQTGVSLGIHESQSRFWEVMIAKSKEFCYYIKDLINEFLNLNVDEEDLFYYFNIVRPDFLRVEADDITYNLHIILRYEIEKLMIDEDIKVDDLPEIWNDLMEKYLGIRPKSYKEGILQDVHWADGLIGYFPTYTLGNLVAAMIKYKIDDLEEKILQGNFSYIRNFLKEKIHKYGSMYSPKELLKKSFNEDLSYEYFIKFIKDRYKK